MIEMFLIVAGREIVTIQYTLSTLMYAQPIFVLVEKYFLLKNILLRNENITFLLRMDFSENPYCNRTVRNEFEYYVA